MKILHLEANRYPDESLLALNKRNTVEAHHCSDQKALESLLASNQYDVIFTRLGLRIDRQVMTLQPGLKYIVTPTTGLNHIDMEAAAARGVRVISLKGETSFLDSIKSTAEHTWALLLALVRHIPAAHQHVLDGGWDRGPFLSDELDGRVLGIIGLGRLGRIVARYGKAFGMTVKAYDADPNQGKSETFVEMVDLQTLLQSAHYVVLLISWSKGSENFMDRDKFAQMREGAWFVNTSRGELVDEDALLEALHSRRLSGAALDVLRDDSAWSGKSEGSAPLLAYAREHSNLLITPHMGGYGKDSIARTRAFVTQKFLEVINGPK
jgi:D-3-phosphoglycerate dehydrogenase